MSACIQTARLLRMPSTQIALDVIPALHARREPHRLYKADANTLVFGSINDPTVDESRMIASAVISTINEDHDQDIVEPSGVILDEYAKNPVVLWEHGHRSIDHPIGKSVIDGQLAVHVFDDRIEADCQFSQRSKTSEQIFALVAEGIIRAASVRIVPIEYIDRGTAAAGGLHAATDSALHSGKRRPAS